MSKPITLKIINAVFKIISFFLPVKKRVLFLGSPRNEKLMKNTQLVYDYINCEKKLIIKLMPHGIFDIIYVSFYIMTSKVIVIDDHYRYFAYIPLKKNQRLVQVWHGPGAFKCIGLDLPNALSRERYSHDQYDAFISTADDVYYCFTSGFGLKKDVIKPLGYPLTDLLINNKEDLEKEFYESFPDLKNKNKLVYLPTYRRYEGIDVLDYDYEINWEKLNEYLEESDSVFIVKKHPLLIFQNIDFVPKDYERIIEVTDIDHYILLAGADLLITDFSSSYFDYLMLNRPIIFYCPDAEEYLSKHGLYIKFPDEVPGEYCETCDDLIEILKTINYNVDYSKYREWYMGACDGHSTEKVAKLIEDFYNE